MKRKNTSSPGTQPRSRRFTYADYCSWPEDERWELIIDLTRIFPPRPKVVRESPLKYLADSSGT